MQHGTFLETNSDNILGKNYCIDVGLSDPASMLKLMKLERLVMI
ncbi:MAG: hypothetical protein MAG715_00460 [Methanonatronarchaeales archaeon]|nr:hypothetical protein [Methanonatronarchaeales archaeon]